MAKESTFSMRSLPGNTSKSAICPIKDIMATYGDKWSLYAIMLLGKHQKLRFSALRSGISGISQRMLTVTLRSLEQDGMVLRTLYHELPPRVEYSITPLGASLFQQVVLMTQWASEHAGCIMENRKKNQAIRVNAERKI